MWPASVGLGIRSPVTSVRVPRAAPMQFLGRVSDAEESGMRAELEQLLAGATLDENPTQGPTAGQTPSEKPTVGSEIGARPDEDSTHAPLHGKRPAGDPTRLTRPRRGAL